LTLLYCKNGPYLKNTYARGSFCSSLWGVRPLNSRISDIATDEAKKMDLITLPDFTEEEGEVSPRKHENNTNTQTMFNSNVPLN
jgi:hypothetical protein